MWRLDDKPLTNMILLIDNYDSFVFNLARYVAELGGEPHVVRNDALSVAEIERLNPQAIILSPGPCTPNEAGVCLDVVRELGSRIPMLGVCLGQQVIGAACGCEVVRAPQPVHGRTSLVQHTGIGVFRGLPNPLRATRYHSLIVREESLPPDLLPTAWSPEPLLMGLQHRSWPVHGVQFHPESVLTEQGHQLLSNFLSLAGLEIRQLAEQKPEVDLPDESTIDDWHAREIEDLTARPL